jgi:serine/threonine protein kinase
MRIYMRHYGGGHLYPMLVEQRERGVLIFPSIALRIALGIARGVRSCHDRKVVHGNIHPETVYLATSWSSNDLCWRAVENRDLTEIHTTEYCALKEYIRQDWDKAVGLNGFEYSFFIDNPTDFKAPQGHHTAFECLGTNPPTQAADIFSLGHLLCSLFTGKRPLRNYLPQYYPKELLDIVRQCTDLLPSSRPSIGKVIETLESTLQTVLWTYNEQQAIDYAHAKLIDLKPMPTVRELSPASVQSSPANSYDVVTPTSVQSVTGSGSVISTASALAHPNPLSDRWSESWPELPKKSSSSFYI